MLDRTGRRKPLSKLYHYRQIVITLLPGDVLEFRESGRRSRFTLPIDTAFRYAVRLTALAHGAARKRRHYS